MGSNKQRNPIKSFHDKYIISSNGCWIWTAASDINGYGRIGIGNNKISVASRFSYVLYFGTIPSGQHVCHACDNPKCVNPKHLFLGSAKDNHTDSVSKGRASMPPIHSGEGHHKAKLSEDKVRKIRNIYRNNNVSQRWLAKKFGVSQPVIGKIIRLELWRNVK